MSLIEKMDKLELGDTPFSANLRHLYASEPVHFETLGNRVIKSAVYEHLGLGSTAMLKEHPRKVLMDGQKRISDIDCYMYCSSINIQPKSKTLVDSFRPLNRTKTYKDTEKSIKRMGLALRKLSSDNLCTRANENMYILFEIGSGKDCVNRKLPQLETQLLFLLAKKQSELNDPTLDPLQIFAIAGLGIPFDNFMSVSTSVFNMLKSKDFPITKALFDEGRLYLCYVPLFGERLIYLEDQIDDLKAQVKDLSKLLSNALKLISTNLPQPNKSFESTV
jgi:hypothetical protein